MIEYERSKKELENFRYKPEVRSTKPNPIREHQLTSIPLIHESTERILRNGKRRGSSTTVTPTSTTKTRSFKIPETPKIEEINSTNEKLITASLINNNDDDEMMRKTSGGGGDDEIGDNYSSRSVSPTTSGISTTSSSPPLLTNHENQLISNPKSTVDNEENLSHTKTDSSIIPYHFTNDMLFPSSTNPLDYFSSTNSFNKLSSTVSSSSPYLPNSSQLYFNSLSSPHYPPISSLSKSTR